MHEVKKKQGGEKEGEVGKACDKTAKLTIVAHRRGKIIIIIIIF